MRKARKAHGDKVILDDVTLMFYPGAKIGVVGPNGAGKSTVLHIMAGLDQPSNGDAFLTPGYAWGSCSRSRHSTRTRTSWATCTRVWPRRATMLNRFNEISDQLADPDADYDKLLTEMGELQEQLDHRNAWDLDAQLEQAMDALQLPPPDADVTVLSGGERRRVALCKLLLQQPDLLLLDEPTNHLDAESVQWLEQHLASVPRGRARGHARPLLPRQRRRVDPRARPWPCLPVRGQLLDLPGEQGRPAPGGGAEGRQAQEAARAGAGVGALEPHERGRRRAGRGCSATRRWRPRRNGRQARLRGDPDPSGSTARQPGHRGRSPHQGVRRSRSHRRPVVLAALATASWALSAPTAFGKTTLFSMLVGDEKPDAGSIRVGDTVQMAYVDQNRANLDPRKSVLGHRVGRARLHQRGTHRDAESGLRQHRSASRVPTSRSRPACCRAASETG